MAKTIIKSVDLRKTYMQGKIPVEALRSVNLEVEEGDFFQYWGFRD